MKNTFARIACAMLASLMLVTAIVSCGGGGTESTTTTAPSGGETTTAVSGEDVTTPAETTNNLDANGYLKDSLPEDLNFNGETVTIYADDNPYAQEFDAESLNGDLINDGIYNRNETVSERLNVTLNFVSRPARSDNAACLSAINSDIQSGAAEYELIGVYSQVPGALAMQGSLVDLKSLDYLDFNKPWWPATMVEQASVGDNLYICTGDISTNLLWMMQVVFFNKDLIKEFNLEDPYTLVDGMNWTVDKMIEMTKGTYEDLNGNGTADEADRYGMTIYEQAFDANFAAAGLCYVDKDADGMYQISPSLTSEKAVNLVTKFCEWVHDSGDVVWSTNISIRAVMAEGRSVFIEDRAFVAKDHLVNQNNFEYGILPAPCYDNQQANYITNIGYPHNIYCISNGISEERMNKAAAVLECLASESYRQVTPALFETTMKIKYSESEIDSEIYDLIKTNIDFDPARIFVKEFGSDLAAMFKKTVEANSTAWSSRTKAVTNVAAKKCIKINETLGN